MKRIFLRTAALILAAAAALSLVCFADDTGDYTYSVSEGGAVITGYTGSKRDLVLPRELGGYPVTGIADDAFCHCEEIRSVIVPDSVMEIGNFAFQDCHALTSVTLPDSVRYIGYCAFMDSAVEHDPAGYDGGVLYIGNHLIKAYESVSGTVSVRDGTVTVAGYAFSDCEELENVILPDSLVSIGPSAFSNCRSLVSLNLPDSIVRIGEAAFSDCVSLASVHLPEGLTVLECGLFNNCESLSNVIIPESVTVIGEDVFYGCVYLGTVEIPEGVTCIGGGAFAECSSLNGIEIPEGVTEIGGYTFKNCSFLTDITIPDTVTEIGEEAFDGTYLAENDEYYTDGVLYIGNHAVKAKKNAWGTISLREGTVTVADSAFSECAYIEKIVFPDSLTHVGARAFNLCRRLSEATLPDGVLTIGDEAFCECSLLRIAVIPEGMTEIGEGVFLNCSSLSCVAIPDGVVRIGERAFEGCSSLWCVGYGGDSRRWNAISIGSRNEELITSNVYLAMKKASLCGDSLYLSLMDGTSHFIRYYGTDEDVTVNGTFDGCPVVSVGESAFYGSRYTERIILPPSVAKIGRSAFYMCPRLVSVNLPEGIGSIPNAAFSGCSSLADLTIPDSVTSVGSFAFRGCVSLKRATLPVGVTAVGRSAFEGCSSLESVTLEKNVASIGDDAFLDCIMLADIYYGGTPEDWSRVERSGAAISSGVTVHFGGQPHDHIWIDDITASTCTEQGFTTHVCSLCGKTVKDSAVPALGHDWDGGEVVIMPSDKAEGLRSFTCRRCGQVKNEAIPMTVGGLVDTTKIFTDVKAGKWYTSAVNYVYTLGLMNGMTDELFAPNDPMSRAMLVTVLWRAEGSPAPGATAPFTDLKAKWYRQAVAWAYERGVVKGTSATAFSPDDPITREQIAAVFYRFAEYKNQDVGARGAIDSFPDGGKVSKYAREAVSWAVAEGLISGTKAGDVNYLDPKGNASRAQVATILMRYLER